MERIYQEIEILTITYKSDHIIEKCLSNIDENFKITVVENSDNKILKKKIEKRKNTKCILTNSNLGFGSAFNIGAIFKMYEVAQDINDLGILSCKESTNITEILNQDRLDVEEVDNVKGFVMLVNNLNCKISGYFDENFFLYLEEIDLCKRLRLLNKKIYISKNIFVKHLAGKSHDPIYSEKMEIQRNWHYMWSLFYFNKKHYGFFKAFRLTIGKFLSAYFKLNFYFFINKKKYLIYKHRFLGLLNSYLNKKSSFRI